MISYVNNSFPTGYVPTVYDNYSANITVNDTPIYLSLWDTAGSDDYDALRPLSYPGTDVFLVLFSVTDPKSFDSVRDKWIPEILQNCPGVPYLLVATKCDLRDDLGTISKMKEAGQAVITYEQGMSMATEVGAVRYLECSSLSRAGLKAVFDELAQVFLSPKDPPKKEKEAPLSENQRTFNARKALLDELLADGTISNDVHSQYILKLRNTFGIY
uniref:Uncharacterized protein n=1 Tax=Arcella intermedia TaxID=1963864 RepID=A0A6B2LGJ1_9EUKA